MRQIPKILTIISRGLYWVSIAATIIAVLVYISEYEKMLAYAFALGSVVAMMLSSILLYICNILSVGSEVLGEEKEGEKSSSEKNLK